MLFLLKKWFQNPISGLVGIRSAAGSFKNRVAPIPVWPEKDQDLSALSELSVSFKESLVKMQEGAVLGGPESTSTRTAGGLNFRP